jgi:prepilin-type processing-associated H-X9-DG protein
MVEILVVVVMIAFLAGLIFPALTGRPRIEHGRINCVSNLKQVGLAMRMFSNDHNDRFPWTVPKAEGGSLEYATSADVFRHFLAVSNELVIPKVLTCGSDSERQRSSDWNFLSNSNVSYFVGLDANEGRPQTILSGDRNLSVGSTFVHGPMTVTRDSNLRVLPGLHQGSINIGFADGSAQQMTESQVKNWIQHTNPLPMRLSVP